MELDFNVNLTFKNHKKTLIVSQDQNSGPKVVSLAFIEGAWNKNTRKMQTQPLVYILLEVCMYCICLQ